MELTKIGIVAGAIVGLGLIGVDIKLQLDQKAHQAELTQSIIEMKQLGDGLVRSQSTAVTKDDLLHLAKDVDLKKIQSDMDVLHAELQAVQTISAHTPGFTKIGVGSTRVTPNNTASETPSNADPYRYLKNIQTLALIEPNADPKFPSIPLGEISFKSWQPKPWDINIYPRNYKITTVLSQDENGKHIAYNKFTVEAQGKEFVIPISQANFEETLPENKFRFSPRLNLGLGGGAAINTTILGVQGFVQPSLSVSLFSLGKTKVDPNWNFLGIGIAFETPNNQGALIITPASYNLGHHIPLMNNLFLGPNIGVDTNKNVAIGLGVSANL